MMQFSDLDNARKSAIFRSILTRLAVSHIQSIEQLQLALLLAQGPETAVSSAFRTATDSSASGDPNACRQIRTYLPSKAIPSTFVTPFNLTSPTYVYRSFSNASSK
jgi:hypothetical protein